MSLKDLFEDVEKHLLNQNCKSVPTGDFARGHSGNIDCAYRGQNGTSCAVGCLIPDTMYTLAMEFKSAQSLLALHPNLFDYLVNKYKIVNHSSIPILLNRLQDIHDSKNVIDWPTELSSLKRSYEFANWNENVSS